MAKVAEDYYGFNVQFIAPDFCSVRGEYKAVESMVTVLVKKSLTPAERRSVEAVAEALEAILNRDETREAELKAAARDQAIEAMSPLFETTGKE